MPMRMHALDFSETGRDRCCGLHCLTLGQALGALLVGWVF